MITDPAVQLLADLAKGLRSEYRTEDNLDWSRSPFAWIRNVRSPRRRGSIAEKLVAKWCRAHHIDVERSSDTEADIVLEGVRTEIKFSTLWANQSYKFQQIRDQDYQLLVCLGVSPFTAHAWIFEKDFLVSNTGLVAGLTYQHGGAEGRDTAWLSVSPTDVHPWMDAHGGDLATAMRRLRALVGLL